MIDHEPVEVSELEESILRNRMMAGPTERVELDQSL